MTARQWLSALIFCILFNHALGQCADTIYLKGKGCLGDTLTTHVNNALRIDWYRDGKIWAENIGYNKPAFGKVIAGVTGLSGLQRNLLNNPANIYIKPNGTLYVADAGSGRVLKFLPGDTAGKLVAGKGDGSYVTDRKHVCIPVAVFVDSKDTIYILENNRVMKWAEGDTLGTLVAGDINCYAGSDTRHFNNPQSFCFDSVGNLYVSDSRNNRIQKWDKGKHFGYTVAGGSAYLLYNPLGICLDRKENLYVVNGYGYRRIQKYAPGAKSGVIVFGDWTKYSTYDSLNYSINSIYVDSSQNIYFTSNNQIRKCMPGYPFSICIAGQASNHYETDSTGFNYVSGLAFDSLNNVYACDYGNNRIMKWGQTTLQSLTGNFFKIADSGGVFKAVVHYKSGCIDTSNIIYQRRLSSMLDTIICYGDTLNYHGIVYKNGGTYQLHFASNIICDSTLTLSVSYVWLGKNIDTGICPGQSFMYDSTLINGPMVAIFSKQTSKGCDSVITLSVHWNNSSALFYDTICEGKTFLFQGKNYALSGLYVDTIITKQGCDSLFYLFLTIQKNHTIIHACTNKGSAYSYNGKKYFFSGIYVDTFHLKNGCDSICYLNLVAFNRRDSIKSLHAGCTNDILQITQLGVSSLDWHFNNQLLKHVNVNHYGITVAGPSNGNGGFDSAHLNGAYGIAVDSAENVYVADRQNARVVKWAPGATYGITVAGTGSPGIDSLHLWYPQGLCLDKHHNLYISDAGTNRVVKWKLGDTFGVTVAGSKSTSYKTNDSTSLLQPNGIYVDDSGNLYIADQGNHRIQYWKKGVGYGITLAGDKNSVAGSDSVHLSFPSDVFVDVTGNLYVADQINNRIQFYGKYATYGVTIAGQGSPLGSYSNIDSTVIWNPTGIFVDEIGNLYVADNNLNRIQLWKKNSNYGITVCGGYPLYGRPNDSVNIEFPHSVFVDKYGSIYVSDNSNRVQKWGPGLNTFSLKADTPGRYSAFINLLGGCTIQTDTFFVKNGNSQSAHTVNLCPGISYIFTKDTIHIAGLYQVHTLNKAGCDSIVSLTLHLIEPYSDSLLGAICPGSYFQYDGNKYTLPGFYTDTVVAWKGCDSIAMHIRVIKSSNSNTYLTANLCKGQSYFFDNNYRTASGIYKSYLTTVFGCDSIITLNLQIDRGSTGSSGHFCNNDTLYINSKDAGRIVLYSSKGDSTVFTGDIIMPFGRTVAGDTHCVADADSRHLNEPAHFLLDPQGNMIIADKGNNRIIKWIKGFNYGVVMAGDYGGHRGNDSIHLFAPEGVCMDSAGNLYIADAGNNRIQLWKNGSGYGITIAGDKKGKSGNDSIHLNYPTAVCLDKSLNLFIADSNRVQMYKKQSLYGVTIAGSLMNIAGTDSATLNRVRDIYIDQNDTLYLADAGNNRIMKWSPGSLFGIQLNGITGDTKSGKDSMHLNFPTGLCLDAIKNVYVADNGNNRIIKFKKGQHWGTIVAGNTKTISGKDDLHLNHPADVSVDDKGAIIISDADNNRIQEYLQTVGLQKVVPNDHGAYTTIIHFYSGCIDTLRDSIFNCAGSVYEFNLRRNELMIYPNPNKGLFTIQINIPYTHKQFLTLKDLMGQIIMTQEMTYFNNRYNLNLDFTNKPSGAYFAQVFSEDNILVGKIIIDK